MFVLIPKFLLYFKSDSPDCRCENVVYVEGCRVERFSGYLGHAHCVQLHLSVPRKPGKALEDNVFLFGTADARSLEVRLSCCRGLS